MPGASPKPQGPSRAGSRIRGNPVVELSGDIPRWLRLWNNGTGRESAPPRGSQSARSGRDHRLQIACRGMIPRQHEHGIRALGSIIKPAAGSDSAACAAPRECRLIRQGFGTRIDRAMVRSVRRICTNGAEIPSHRRQRRAALLHGVRHVIFTVGSILNWRHCGSSFGRLRLNRRAIACRFGRVRPQIVPQLVRQGTAAKTPADAAVRSFDQASGRAACSKQRGIQPAQRTVSRRWIKATGHKGTPPQGQRHQTRICQKTSQPMLTPARAPT